MYAIIAREPSPLSVLPVLARSGTTFGVIKIEEMGNKNGKWETSEGRHIVQVLKEKWGNHMEKKRMSQRKERSLKTNCVYFIIFPKTQGVSKDVAQGHY